jgi:hypothetical protein
MDWKRYKAHRLRRACVIAEDGMGDLVEVAIHWPDMRYQVTRALLEIAQRANGMTREVSEICREHKKAAKASNRQAKEKRRMRLDERQDALPLE